MGIEEDHEHLGEQMRKAMASITATQPDPLTFTLRGKEIQGRLVKMAESAEAEADKLASDNVRHIRPRRALPMPPGYPEPSEEAQREAELSLAKSYRQAAEDFRFLAAHVDEDRIFRLAVSDMASLGFMIGPLAHTHGGYR